VNLLSRSFHKKDRAVKIWYTSNKKEKEMEYIREKFGETIEDRS